MTAPWKETCCASIPVEDLEVLADLRGRADIRVYLTEGRAWVCWENDSEFTVEIVAGRILPLRGAELFAGRGGQWYRLGAHLPAFDVPFQVKAAGVPLDRLLVPSKLRAERPDQYRHEPLLVRLVRDEKMAAMPATAMRCSLELLSAWAERATSWQFSALQGAWSRGSLGGERDAEVLVLGSARRLPLLPQSVRYWGTDRLIPLGFRTDPELPEQAIRRLLGAGSGDLAVLDAEGFELIERRAFRPLSRASIRLASAGSSGPGQRKETGHE